MHFAFHRTFKVLLVLSQQYLLLHLRVADWKEVKVMNISTSLDSMISKILINIISLGWLNFQRPSPSSLWGCLPSPGGYLIVCFQGWGFGKRRLRRIEASIKYKKHADKWIQKKPIIGRRQFVFIESHRRGEIGYGTPFSGCNCSISPLINCNHVTKQLSPLSAIHSDQLAPFTYQTPLAETNCGFAVFSLSMIALKLL